MFLGNPMKKSDDSREKPPAYLVSLSIPQEEVQRLSSVHGAPSLRRIHRLPENLMWPTHKSFHNVSMIPSR